MNFVDPVAWVVREAEWAIHGRCEATDEHGHRCRFIAEPHYAHLIMHEEDPK